MASLYAVIAKTTAHDIVVDSIWEKYDWANNRANVIWDYPDIFMASVEEYEPNKVDLALEYEANKDLLDEDTYYDDE